MIDGIGFILSTGTAANPRNDTRIVHSFADVAHTCTGTVSIAAVIVTGHGNVDRPRSGKFIIAHKVVIDLAGSHIIQANDHFFAGRHHTGHPGTIQLLLALFGKFKEKLRTDNQTELEPRFVQFRILRRSKFKDAGRNIFDLGQIFLAILFKKIDAAVTEAVFAAGPVFRIPIMDRHPGFRLTGDLGAFGNKSRAAVRGAEHQFAFAFKVHYPTINFFFQSGFHTVAGRRIAGNIQVPLFGFLNIIAEVFRIDIPERKRNNIHTALSNGIKVLRPAISSIHTIETKTGDQTFGDTFDRTEINRFHRENLNFLIADGGLGVVVNFAFAACGQGGIHKHIEHSIVTAAFDLEFVLGQLFAVTDDLGNGKRLDRWIVNSDFSRDFQIKFSSQNFFLGERSTQTKVDAVDDLIGKVKFFHRRNHGYAFYCRLDLEKGQGEHVAGITIGNEFDIVFALVIIQFGGNFDRLGAIPAGQGKSYAITGFKIIKTLFGGFAFKSIFDCKFPSRHRHKKFQRAIINTSEIIFAAQTVVIQTAGRDVPYLIVDTAAIGKAHLTVNHFAGAEVFRTKPAVEMGNLVKFSKHSKAVFIRSGKPQPPFLRIGNQVVNRRSFLHRSTDSTFTALSEQTDGVFFCNAVRKLGRIVVPRRKSGV